MTGIKGFPLLESLIPGISLKFARRRTKSAHANKCTYWLSKKENLKATLWCDFKELGQLMRVCRFQIFFKISTQKNLNKPYSSQMTALSGLGQKKINKIPSSMELTIEWRWKTQWFKRRVGKSWEREEMLCGACAEERHIVQQIVSLRMVRPYF